ncbi:hypothetical protein NEFER03_0142 [Nematocida sp. LUAm3]|nr:hypothetical protein NEFER03_0142 [Nematocida sp. LUAm3]KAI5173595.1 hypothetical protein NEFER02_0111 [Nematocida sp. LUAm2]KAI5176816.1 hypothetical protein NEFER01_0141 [Nematocida sp. LUAm1]
MGKRAHLLKRSMEALSIVGISVFLRKTDIPNMLSLISYYDTAEAYEYINGNPYAHAPYMLSYVTYSIIGKRYIKEILFLFDIITAYVLQSPWYLLLSSVLPLDAFSVISLICALVYKSSGKTKKCLQIVLGALMLESTAENMHPGINAYWYVNIQMIPQYIDLHRHLFYSTHIFFWCLSWLSQETATRLFLGMCFREGGPKGYLLLWSLILLESKKVFQNTSIDQKVINGLKGASILFYIIQNIVWWMLAAHGVGNMNFLCWSILFMIICTAAATLYLEIRKKEMSRIKRKAE